MQQTDCIFCKIVQKKISAEIIYEDDEILAFKDAFPIAPVHILIIPKNHFSTVNEWKEKDIPLAGKIVWIAQRIANDLQISAKGYKLLFRGGSDGGQEVPHIHLHLIGGAKLIEDIHPQKEPSRN